MKPKDNSSNVRARMPIGASDRRRPAKDWGWARVVDPLDTATQIQLIHPDLKNTPYRLRWNDAAASKHLSLYTHVAWFDNPVLAIENFDVLKRRRGVAWAELHKLTVNNPDQLLCSYGIVP